MMTPPLTEREIKMLRERCVKHRCVVGGFTSEQNNPDPDAMAFGSELLRAAKEKAALIARAIETKTAR